MWIKAPNGNVFEVEDKLLVDKLVAEGCKASETDPRVKPEPRRKSAES